MKIEILEKHSSLPKIGIYFLFKNNQLVYIGQSIDIELRIRNHYKEKDFDTYSYVLCLIEELNDVEKKYIQKYTPILNKRLNTNAKKERSKLPYLIVYNKEIKRMRKYYSIFDIKKKYQHLNIDELDNVFKNKGKAKIEDHLLIIY